jgi:DNA-binding transcriptional regulator YiaG
MRGSANSLTVSIQEAEVTLSDREWSAEYIERLDELIRADLRRIREGQKVSQEDVSQYAGHEKPWLSKIELGQSRIYLSDYLMLMHRLGAEEPEHPGAMLVDYFVRGPGRKLKGVKRTRGGPNLRVVDEA